MCKKYKNDVFSALFWGGSVTRPWGVTVILYPQSVPPLVVGGDRGTDGGTDDFAPGGPWTFVWGIFGYGWGYVSPPPSGGEGGGQGTVLRLPPLV